MQVEASCASSFAFFVQDEGGWWTFKGIHVDREEGIRLVEMHKHGPHCRSIVAMELPSGKKILRMVDLRRDEEHAHAEQRETPEPTRTHPRAG